MTSVRDSKRTPNAPKKPQSAYILFCTDQRSKDEDLKKLTPTEQSTALAARWTDTSQDVRTDYEKRADELRVQYAHDMEAYRQTDEYKESQTRGKTGKKKITAFSLYAGDQDRPTPPEGDTATSTSLVSRWQQLTDAQRQPYKDKAQKLNEEAAAALAS